MKQLCGKSTSDILYFLVVATILQQVIVQCFHSEPSASLVAEIIQSTREISISFSGVTDNGIYSQVSNSYQPYTIDAVQKSNLISGASRIHVASNVTGKYSQLFRNHPPGNFFLILEPKEINLTARDRDSRNFVIINQGRTFLSSKQGMVEIREPEVAYRRWNAMMNSNSDTESRITATCLSCRPKVQEFVKSIAESLSVDDMFYGSHIDYYEPKLVFMNRYERFDENRLEYSPFLIGHDELAFALPLRRRHGTRWWASFIEQYLFPWDPQVWYSVGLTWLSAAVLFMLTGLVLMKKRTFYYTGRKLLEVMAVIRFPLKKDSSTGKGAAVVLKTGLSIVFIAYVQLLIKQNTARTGEDHALHNYDWDTICRLDQDSFDIMGPRYFMEKLRWKRQSRSCLYQRYQVQSGSESPVKDSMDHFEDALGECQRRLRMGKKVACFGMKSVLEDDYDFSDYARIRVLDRWELPYVSNYEVQITAQTTCSGCRSRLRDFNRLMEAGIYIKFDEIYEEGRSGNVGDQERLYRYHGPIPFTLGELGRLFDAWALGLSICSFFFIVEKIFSYRPIFPKAAFKHAIILSAAVLLSLSVTLLQCFDFAVEYWPNLSAEQYIPMYSLYGSHIAQHLSTYVIVILSTLIKTNVKDRKLGVIFAYIDKVIWILVTFSWVGFALACWWFSEDIFNYRAFPALLVAIFTPIN